MAVQLPVGTVTFMLTDVEGSTLLWESAAAEIIELAQQAGDSSLEITGHVWQLADLFEMGDILGADREIDTHEELSARVGYPHFIAHGLMFRATQAILRGEFADAEALAARSLALGEQVGDVNVRISHHVQMAVLRALQGRPRDATAYFEPVVRDHPPELAKLANLTILCIAGDLTGIKEAFPGIWRARDRIPPAYGPGAGDEPARRRDHRNAVRLAPRPNPGLVPASASTVRRGSIPSPRRQLRRRAPGKCR